MSSTAVLEHVNITVSDAAATAARLCRVFGWKVRWSGPSIHEGHSVHVGGKDHYIALYTAKAPREDIRKNYISTPRKRRSSLQVMCPDLIRNTNRAADSTFLMRTALNMK